MIDKPGIYDIPATEYHADPCPEPSLSASVARTLVERSPLHAWMKHPRLSNQIVEQPPSKMALGTAAHSVILQGDWSGIGFIAGDNYRTKVSKELRDKIIEIGGTPLLEKDRSTVEAMVAEFERAGIDRRGMETERTLVWQDKATESATPIWCRARVDLLGDRLILDLKTTAVPATPERWGRTLLWDYAMQCGFYRRGYRALKGGKPPAFRFLVQETTPPYSVAQFAFDEAGRDYADYLAEQAVWTWGECLKSQTWTSYPAGVNVIEAPYWVREKLEEG